MNNNQTVIPSVKAKITWMNDDTSAPKKASASITIGNSFMVNGLSIVQGQKGLFVSMPQRVSEKDGQPEIIAVLEQLVLGFEFPIRHIADQEDPLGGFGLAGGIGTEGHGRTVLAVVDTVTHSCRTSFLRRCQTGYIIPIGSLRTPYERIQTDQTNKQLAHNTPYIYYIL